MPIISNSNRFRVYRKFNGRCAYCGNHVPFDSFQIDHIVPDQQNNKLANLNPSCRTCNYFKSNLSIENFRLRIKHIQNLLWQHNANLKLLTSFDMVKFNTVDIVFYFEKGD